MVKLRKGQNIHGTLQNAVVAAINDPNYSFSLPQLSDWESVVASTADEKQRLEFVGDAIMHLSVALYLYRLFPDAAPGLYTNIRSAVNTNATFTHLMVKAGAYELPSQSRSTKVAADSFEVIIAALYLERGFADVCAWVQDQYGPLIAAARESYDRCLTTTNTPFDLFSTKRRIAPFDPASTPLLKKTRLSSARNSPRSTLMAQRIINRMKSKGKVRLCFPARKLRPPFAISLRSNSKSRTLEPMRPSPVIDLTVDSDSDEATALSTSGQASQHKPTPDRPCQTSHLPSESNIVPQVNQSCMDTSVHWSPRQGYTASRSPSRSSLEPMSISSVASSSIATPPDHTTSNVLHPNIECSKRPSLSLPPQSNHISSGTYENPIVIEDSDSED